MDGLTKLYYQSAIDLGLKPEIIPPISGFRIFVQGTPYYFRIGATPLNTESVFTLASNKYTTNRLLNALGYPVPKATALHLEEFEEDPALAMLDVPFPVVCKPTINTSCGDDVFCNIQDKK